MTDFTITPELTSARKELHEQKQVMIVFMAR